MFDIVTDDIVTDRFKVHVAAFELLVANSSSPSYESTVYTH